MQFTMITNRIREESEINKIHDVRLKIMMKINWWLIEVG